MRRTSSLLGALALAAGLLVPAMAQSAMPSASLTDAVRRDTEWLAGYPSRAVGTPGHDQAFAELLAKVRAVPGACVWTHSFPVVVPTISRCDLTVPGETEPAVHQIYPLWPELARQNTTSADGISGQVLYIGAGAPSNLPPRSMRGSIVVLEMENYENWKSAFNSGATAMLLLGGGEITAPAPAFQPYYFPRYYVPAGPLADSLRRGEIARATIHCDGAWIRTQATNIYALVTPKGGGNGEQAFVYAAAFDSMSMVMGLAPGADTALDTALLLNLLREAGDQPPARPVLFAFVDAYGQNQLGARRMLGMLTVTPNQEDRKEYEKEDDKIMEAYVEALALLKAFDREPDRFARLYRKEYRPLHQYFKDELSPPVINAERLLPKLRLAADKAKEPLKSEILAQIKDLSFERGRLNTLRNQLLSKQKDTEEMRPLAEAMLKAVKTRARRQFVEETDAADLYRMQDQMRDGISSALGLPPGTNVTPVSFMLGFDLSGEGLLSGPLLTCGHLHNGDGGSSKDLLRWLRTTESESKNMIWDKDTIRGVCTRALGGLDELWSFNPGLLSALSSPAQGFALPAVTWATLETMRFRLDTPLDTADRLNWSWLEPQIGAAATLARRLVYKTDFVLSPESGLKPAWRRVRGTIVSESASEPVPRVPMPGYLVTLVPDPWVASARGVRRNEFVFTSTDGRFRMEEMAGKSSLGVMKGEAYKLAPDGRIISAVVRDTSLYKASKETTTVDLGPPLPSPIRSVVFDCVEMNGPDFFDPRFLEPLSDMSFFDVIKGAAPPRANLTMANGQLFGLVEPDLKWYLIMRAGAAGNRMVLINVDDTTKEPGRGLKESFMGFGVTNGLPSLTAHLAARDFFRIDEWRLANLHRAGISSEAIEALHGESGKLLAEADAALENDDGAGQFRAGIQSLAREVRAYQAIRDTENDVARGAIFLLLLILPFSIAMERLLFAGATISRKIYGVLGIFVAMTLVLRSFHPAFRITNQPLIVIMAFVVLALSSLVIGMVLTRFGTYLDEIRSGRAEGSGAKTSRGGLVGSAIWLGIENMRKRKFRTALTGITIMLITFALLCFSSARSYTSERQFRVPGAKAGEPGALVRRSGLRSMHPNSLRVLESLLKGERLLAPRYWLSNSSPEWRIQVTNPKSAKSMALKGLVGLSGNEGGISGVGRALPDWNGFAVRRDGCYLAASVAKELGVKAGDSVVISGQALVLSGVFEPGALEKEVRMLDGQSMLPLDYTTMDAKQSSKSTDTSIEQAEQEMKSGGTIDVDTGLPTVDGAEVAIVNSDFCKSVGGSLRAVGIEAKDQPDAELTARSLVQTLAFPIYYTAADGVRVIVSVPLLPKAPRSLVVPLIIASLIIFATMLNSVAERKGEIHVYTSLGLAPVHVGALFITEAATYGLMGSIFGYVVGQGIATLMSKLGLMGGITLNYSGTQVIMTMGLVLGVTILSGVVPAIVAGRIATPNADMRWRLPVPEKGVITDVLPFTATPVAADGVVAYIYEYMDAHRDGAIGHFTCDELGLHEVMQGGKARPVISAVVWLAPYDLGVRQQMLLSIKERETDVCEVAMELRRLAGQEKAWIKLNRQFVGDLRRQFLGWRNLGKERVLRYIETGVKMERAAEEPARRNA